MARGISPIDLMLRTMRRHWSMATTKAGPTAKAPRVELPEAEWDEKYLGLAMEAADDAAPFCHPKLATHEVSGKGGGGIPLALSGSVRIYLPANNRAGPRAGA